MSVPTQLVRFLLNPWPVQKCWAAPWRLLLRLASQSPPRLTVPSHATSRSPVTNFWLVILKFCPELFSTQILYKICHSFTSYARFMNFTLKNDVLHEYSLNILSWTDCIELSKTSSEEASRIIWYPSSVKERVLSKEPRLWCQGTFPKTTIFTKLSKRTLSRREL